ncbi:MAG: MFS transporter [Bryobacteraceae bacterium]|jgi:MFS family permease
MTSGAHPRANSANTSRGHWMVLALLVVSVAINYVDRGNLSVAGRDLAAELRLPPDRLGLLFSAFFWTYALFQIPAGWLIDRYDVVRVYAACYLLWSVATACTGLVSTLGGLFALRLLLGMSESVAYPSYSKIIAANFREERRGMANALIDAGSRAGPAFGVLIGGLILERYGWRVMFLSIGAASLLWLLPWMAVAPRVATTTAGANSGEQAGFRQILGRRESWGSFFALFSGNYAWYFLLTWMPPYLLMERHYSRHAMALYGWLPFAALAISSLAGGWLSDRLIARGATPIRVRKAFVATGLTFATILAASAVCRDEKVAMGLMIVACISLGMYSSNIWATTQTLAGPQAAAKWTGMQNAFGNLAGVTAPYITGLIVRATGSFYLAFAGVAVVLLLGALAFLLLIPRAVQIRWERTECAT